MIAYIDRRIAEGGAKKPYTKAELEDIVMGYVQRRVQSYQMSAWLMTIVFQPLSDAETFALTQVMLESGDRIRLDAAHRELDERADVKHRLRYIVDKHSTGGVGDKISIVLGPVCAALGACVAKMSGRGLGSTGGTLDKLETIPGFRVELETQRFIRIAKTVGCCIAGQSENLTPADAVLYKLRSATSSFAIRSLPLIASSIMSKKLCSPSKAIVLDVKVGCGAFLKTAQEAEALAKLMIAIGTAAKRSVSVVYSPMDEPLGFAVGNALEVQEAMACLRGNGPKDVQALVVKLACTVLSAAGMPGIDEKAVLGTLTSGAAYACFEQWIRMQGGDLKAFDAQCLALEKQYTPRVVKATTSGVVRRLDALLIAEAAMELGAGRFTKEESVEPHVGIRLHVKCGTVVHSGDVLFQVLHKAERGLTAALALLQQALLIE
jgi:pyrimidine-nucleoside phosphorylase/thymidine phosphorylase